MKLFHFIFVCIMSDSLGLTSKGMASCQRQIEGGRDGEDRQHQSLTARRLLIATVAPSSWHRVCGKMEIAGKRIRNECAQPSKHEELREESTLHKMSMQGDALFCHCVMHWALCALGCPCGFGEVTVCTEGP